MSARHTLTLALLALATMLALLTPPGWTHGVAGVLVLVVLYRGGSDMAGHVLRRQAVRERLQDPAFALAVRDMRQRAQSWRRFAERAPDTPRMTLALRIAVAHDEAADGMAELHRLCRSAQGETSRQTHRSGRF